MLPWHGVIAPRTPELKADFISHSYQVSVMVTGADEQGGDSDGGCRLKAPVCAV